MLMTAETDKLICPTKHGTSKNINHAIYTPKVTGAFVRFERESFPFVRFYHWPIAARSNEMELKILKIRASHIFKPLFTMVTEDFNAKLGKRSDTKLNIYFILGNGTLQVNYGPISWGTYDELLLRDVDMQKVDINHFRWFHQELDWLYKSTK